MRPGSLRSSGERSARRRGSNVQRVSNTRPRSVVALRGLRVTDIFEALGFASPFGEPRSRRRSASLSRRPMRLLFVDLGAAPRRAAERRSAGRATSDSCPGKYMKASSPSGSFEPGIGISCCCFYDLETRYVGLGDHFAVFLEVALDHRAELLRRVADGHEPELAEAFLYFRILSAVRRRDAASSRSCGRSRP